MSERATDWRADQLEGRVERLERRVDQNESRTSQRIFDVYSTIYWVLFIVLVGAEIGLIAAAATKH
jgi:uncharacterized protein Yka (UPF0111/DUF47 family)